MMFFRTDGKGTFQCALTFILFFLFFLFLLLLPESGELRRCRRSGGRLYFQ